MSEAAATRRIVTFRDLDVWQKSMTLAEACFAAARLLPDAERFGLAIQIRRAAVSLPSNIAEGHQLSAGSYRHHVCVALGSLAELDTQIELAGRVGILPREVAAGLQPPLEDVRRMLVRLRAALSPDR